MSIKGVANFYKDKKRHIITTQTERAPYFLPLLPQRQQVHTCTKA